MEGEKRRKSQRVVSQQSFSSSPPLQVKDSQARKPHPAPQPSAVPQELPGSTPTEPVSSSPAYPPTHPPSIQHPAPSHREKQPVRGDLCFTEASTGKRDDTSSSILYVYLTLKHIYTCKHSKHTTLFIQLSTHIHTQADTPYLSQ